MDTGKKIFFLYPHHFINDLIIDIIKNEYEAYLIHDHIKILDLLKTYHNSILYINIDEVLKEPEWENYINTLRTTPELKDIRIGIMTHFHIAPSICEKYLGSMGIECGFIKIGTDLNKCLEQLLKMLEANDTKGNRKYVRAFCNPSLDTFNIITNATKQEGRLLDISIAGMAVIFNDKDFDLDVNTKLMNIQIKLRGAICSVFGIINYKRKSENGVTTYIVMFDQKHMTPEVKNKIHTFICHCLQDSIKHHFDEAEKYPTKQKGEPKKREV